MPVRPVKSGSEPQVNPTNKSSDLGVDESVLDIGIKASSYLAVKKNIDGLTKDADKIKAVIKTFMTSENKAIQINGEHKELYAPTGDGVNEVFIQLQKKKSIKTVDNLIAALRLKVGARIEPFITTVETISPTAIESLYNMKLLTDQDVMELTTTTESTSLIVKLNK